MSPQYVKVYVKRNKNDAVDAEAICAARFPSRGLWPNHSTIAPAATRTVPQCGDKCGNGFSS